MVDSITPHEFIQDLELYIKSSDIPQDILLRQVLPTLFDKEAKLWYSCRKTFNSYQHFRSEFIKYYNSPAYIEQLQEQFLRRSQHKEEPVTHYSFIIRSFYKLLDLHSDDQVVIQRIISKLCPKYIKYFIHQHFNDLNEFEDYAIAVDNAVIREKSYVPPPPAQYCIEPSLAWNYNNKQYDSDSESSAGRDERGFQRERRDNNRRDYKREQREYKKYEYSPETRRKELEGNQTGAKSPDTRESNTGRRDGSRDHRRVSFEQRSRSPSPASSPRRKDEVRCYSCFQTGHYANACENRNKKPENNNNTKNV
jgi:hypothetical protein